MVFSKSHDIFAGLRFFRNEHYYAKWSGLLSSHTFCGQFNVFDHRDAVSEDEKQTHFDQSGFKF